MLDTPVADQRRVSDRAAAELDAAAMVLADIVPADMAQPAPGPPRSR